MAVTLNEATVFWQVEDGPEMVTVDDGSITETVMVFDVAELAVKHPPTVGVITTLRTSLFDNDPGVYVEVVPDVLPVDTCVPFTRHENVGVLPAFDALAVKVPGLTLQKLLEPDRLTDGVTLLTIVTLVDIVLSPCAPLQL